MNRGYLLVGVVGAAGGLLVLLVPSLGRGVGPGPLLVALAGAVAVGQGLLVAVARYRARRDRAEPPPVETATDLSAPGEGFDERLARLEPDAPQADEAAVRERLEAAALRVLVREGHSRETARELLETGEWTDDPEAAAFFAPGGDASSGSLFGAALAGEAPVRRRARRAARAVAARAEGERE